MKYELKRPGVWSQRWAILDECGTEICDGPYEQLEIGTLIVSLLNGVNTVQEQMTAASNKPKDGTR